MRKLRMVYVLTALICGVLCAGNAAAQRKYVWMGEWSVSARFTPGTLKIKPVSATKFKFTVESMNGANMGEISGVAVVKGGKAIFDDRKSTEKDAEKDGCILTFINKGKTIELVQNDKCWSYGGLGVRFEGYYLKGKAQKLNETFVDLEVFPNAQIDRKFKLLVGKDYEMFLDAFHQIYPEDDLDASGATVFSACVRGVCPWNAGIIMFDQQGNFRAAVMNADKDDKAYVRYYSNMPEWTDKLPKTIQTWFDDKLRNNEGLTVVYKNKK